LFYGAQLFFIWFLLKYYHFGFTVVYQIISYDRHINVLTVLFRIRTLLRRSCSAPPTIRRHDSLLLHCGRLGTVTRLDVVGEQEPKNRHDVEAVRKPSNSRQLLSLHLAPCTCAVAHGELSILPKYLKPK